jgi:hypothetical protein
MNWGTGREGKSKVMVKNDDSCVETLENRKVTTTSVFTLGFCRNTIRTSAFAGWINSGKYLIEKELYKKKNDTIKGNFDLCRSADWTGLEPATSAVTGRHSNQLNYQSNLRFGKFCGIFCLQPPRFSGWQR